MGSRVKGNPVLVVALVLLLTLAAGFYAGCGGGGKKSAGKSYEQAVLDWWSKIKDTSDELVEDGGQIKDEGDLEDFSGALEDARKEIASFEEELGGLEAPAGLRESNGALEDFLSAYGDYLETMGDFLDEVLEGDHDAELPDFLALVDEAQEALEDYRDSQDFNPAALDEDIWDLDVALTDAMLAIYVGEEPGSGDWEEPLAVVDTYYTSLSMGDGEAMYRLIDPDSPILDAVSRDFFLVQVGEAYDASMEADYTVDDVQASTGDEGEWVTVYLTVDYSETVDMEGNPVPGHSGEVAMKLHNTADGWLIYEIESEAGLW